MRVRGGSGYGGNRSARERSRASNTKTPRLTVPATISSQTKYPPKNIVVLASTTSISCVDRNPRSPHDDAKPSISNSLHTGDTTLSVESTKLKNYSLAPCASSETPLELSVSSSVPAAYVHVNLPPHSTFKVAYHSFPRGCISHVSIPIGLTTAAKCFTIRVVSFATFLTYRGPAGWNINETHVLEKQ